MSHADELHLYATNEGDLYREHTMPTQRALVAKKIAGTYSRQDAMRRFLPMVSIAAARWNREFSESRQRFTAADKKEVADEMARYFEVEYDLGNYAHLTPGHEAIVTTDKKTPKQLDREVSQYIGRGFPQGRPARRARSRRR